MVNLTVYLDPPLTGALAKLYYIVEGIYFHAIDLPTSVDGIINIGIGADPTLVYILVFPQQTIGGVTYRETESETFNLLNDVVLYVTLEPVSEPPTPPKPITALLEMVIPLIAGVAIIKFGR